MRYPVILTDIEGTTSSIDFVHRVLFPYARERLPGFVRAHRHDPLVRQQLEATARDGDVDSSDPDALIALLLRWIDADRKATPLKALQGMIWETGYRAGDFRAHVYADAVTAMQRWHAEGRRLAVYSSGSIAAQRLLFGHTEAGDLTPLLSDYFDTTSGGKRDAESYRHIAVKLDAAPTDIVFLSDIEAELDAAATAGLGTRWLRRDLDAGDPLGIRHHPARTFLDLAV